MLMRVIQQLDFTNKFFTYLLKVRLWIVKEFKVWLETRLIGELSYGNVYGIDNEKLYNFCNA